MLFELFRFSILCILFVFNIVLETFDDDQWIENFRMKRETFASLCRDMEASLAPSDHAVRVVVDVFGNPQDSS
jgi:hypothetical protein